MSEIRMVLIFVLAATVFLPCANTQPDQKNLPIGLAPFEELELSSRAPLTDPPRSPIRALGEWEDAEYAMTLWVNSSLVGNLARRAPVKILADSESDVAWWNEWLDKNGISRDKVSYFVVATNSIWIRDYGPWYIIDGFGNLGMVDNKYNRPRPLDDVVPQYISRQTGVPCYQPGLVHTGGNFYCDGLGNGFSSTLVYSENSDLAKATVDQRMKDYLGIERYITGNLCPGITIEHFDTFGKLVAPDTIVFSEFPSSSKYRADSEAMHAKLAALKSPYGTPYKIHRMKMISKGGDNYRAYINSFISNRVLYYPTYGNDENDTYAADVYRKALPGYEIVGVDGMSTSWGDSVHCRTRNIMKRETVLIFPVVSNLPADARTAVEVIAAVFPSPGAVLAEMPELHYRVNGAEMRTLTMALCGDRVYSAVIPPQDQGSRISLYIEAEDSKGIYKAAPATAPLMTIDYEIE